MENYETLRFNRCIWKLVWNMEVIEFIVSVMELFDRIFYVYFYFIYALFKNFNIVDTFYRKTEPITEKICYFW